MKLWQVIQWGNIDDGPDGHDTQCIISAATMDQAIEKALIHLPIPAQAYKRGMMYRYPDAIYLLGQDDRPDGEAVLIVPAFVRPAFNLGRNRAWHHATHEAGESKQWKEQNLDEDK